MIEINDIKKYEKTFKTIFSPDTILKCVGIYLLFRIISFLFVHNSEDEYYLLTIEIIIWVILLINIETRIYSIFVAKKEIRTPIF